MKNDQQIHISVANTKMGAIPSFSLTPGITCSRMANRTCYRYGCYARKLYNLRPSVRDAWDENTLMVMRRPYQVESQLNGYLAFHSPKYFRVHVAGDFLNLNYAHMWARIAKAHPETTFLAFTKQFGIVREVRWPKNFRLIMSEWPGAPVPEDLAAAYPMAKVINSKERAPEGFEECPGNCETCLRCFNESVNTYFHKH